MQKKGPDTNIKAATAIQARVRGSNTRRSALGVKIHDTICGLHTHITPETDWNALSPFGVVREALVHFRRATFSAHSKGKREGWFELEMYTSMQELGRCAGVDVREYELVRLDFYQWNLAGPLPSASLAELDTLVELWLCDNDLQGMLPSHMGSASCLPCLQRLHVQDNKVFVWHAVLYGETCTHRRSLTLCVWQSVADLCLPLFV
jgi:hypothetical protein